MTHKIDPNNLRPGPIRHEQLPLSLVARINHLRLTLKEVYPQPMETWLDGFQRDANPESEVRWWERIARCYQSYTDTKILNAEQKRAAFSILFQVAMGLQPKEAEAATLPDGALEEIVTMLGERIQ
jgi:hypothetical protein